MKLDEIVNTMNRVAADIPHREEDGDRLIVFTGWKTDKTGQTMSDDHIRAAAERDFEPAEVGFVAQWVWYEFVTGERFYVNLPGMENGKFKDGETFYIGTERATLLTPKEEIARLVKAGREELERLASESKNRTSGRA